MRRTLFTLITSFILIVAVFFRIYNLFWGAPYFFHPDEKSNIAFPILSSNSVLMLDQTNFDTGTLPLVIIKNSMPLVHSLIKEYGFDRFQLAIATSRVYSLFFSILILASLFFTGERIFGTKQGVLTFLSAAFSTGFIQFSHFGTIELWETFFALMLFVYSWKIIKRATLKNSVIAGIILGVSLATKILNLVLLGPLVAAFALFAFEEIRKRKPVGSVIKQTALQLAVLITTSIITFSLASIQTLLHFSTFQASIHFESGVATGQNVAFFTQSFLRSIPILFQFTKIYPFLLNPLMTILFVPCFFFVFYKGLAKHNYVYLLLVAYYLLLFLPQAFLFAKWTRYMMPTLPFMYLIISVGIIDTFEVVKTRLKKYYTLLWTGTVFLVVLINFVFAYAYFFVAFIEPDTRIMANRFLQLYATPSMHILSEPYDVGIAAFQSSPTIEYFNFYQLDMDLPPDTIDILSSRLMQSDFILLPSQRIVRSRFMNTKDFPISSRFYIRLFNGTLGFTKIYQTPCDLFCNITYRNNPVFSFEETANVFDRPTVFIFKKTRSITASEYQKLLTNS